MSRLFLLLTAGVFLALPPLLATGTERQDDEDKPWKSLYSVVSHRGVRVNMVQTPPAPAADLVPDVPVSDEPATPEPEAPAEAEATSAPADEETESPGDEEGDTPVDEPAPQPVLTPESLGPVRAEIGDLGQPDAIPVPSDVSPMPQTPPSQTSSAAPCATSTCSTGCGQSSCGLRGHRQQRAAAAASGENPHCPCQMPQHYSYFPEMHGYYYFRPYNWTHIREHQRIVSEWGEDPRNPYGRQLFEQVYADYQAEKEAEAGPFLEPGDAEVPLPPEGN